MSVQSMLEAMEAMEAMLYLQVLRRYSVEIVLCLLRCLEVVPKVVEVGDKGGGELCSICWR